MEKVVILIECLVVSKTASTKTVKAQSTFEIPGLSLEADKSIKASFYGMEVWTPLGALNGRQTGIRPGIRRQARISHS